MSFKNPKNLGELILAVQRKDKVLTEYFDAEKFKIDFPHFMVAMIRKMKMASKKNSSKPFFNPQKNAPQVGGVMPWGQMPMQVPGQFFPMAAFPGMPQQPPYGGKGKKQQIQGIPESVYGQMGFEAQGPAQAKGKPQPAKGGQFGTIEDLIKNKSQFLALEESERNGILRKHLTTKFQNYPKMIDL